MGPATPNENIQIDELVYLRRVVSRLTLRAEIAEEAADKYAALCDMLNAELTAIKEGRELTKESTVGEGHD
jgi:hypothetical protein